MALLKNKVSFHYPIDRSVAAFLRAASLSSSFIVILILAFLVYEVSLGEVLGVFPQFFTDPIWSPTEGEFNLAPMLGASVLSALGAVILCGPLGLLSGLFLNLFAPKPVAIVFRRILELLSAIPSVVYGFWGLTLLVPFVDKWFPPGAGLFTAILVLALMILPTTSLMMDAAFQSVGKKQYLSVYSLGLGEWGVSRLLLLPSTLNTMVTALLLSLGRAIGETMAVMMVCGNIVQWPGGLFDPIRTLTANIALELGYAGVEHRSVLFASGLILLVLVAVLVFISTFFESRFRGVKSALSPH